MVNSITLGPLCNSPTIHLIGLNQPKNGDISFPWILWPTSRNLVSIPNLSYEILNQNQKTKKKTLNILFQNLVHILFGSSRWIQVKRIERQTSRWCGCYLRCCIKHCILAVSGSLILLVGKDCQYLLLCTATDFLLVIWSKLSRLYSR